MVLVDTLAAAAAVGVEPRNIRKWAHRYPERLPRRGADAKGRTLYNLQDVYDTAALLRAATV